MNINVQTQAVLLLTAYFTKPGKDDPRPLTPIEWGRFALWRKEREISPGDLLTDDPAKLLAGWADGKVTLERIRHLLGRAGAFGLAFEKWQRAGLWVLTRSDANYPARLKKHLKTDSPPVLFGCGNRHLLNRGGVSPSSVCVTPATMIWQIICPSTRRKSWHATVTRLSRVSD